MKKFLACVGLILFFVPIMVFAQDSTTALPIDEVTDMIGGELSGWVIMGVGFIASLVTQGFKKLKVLGEANPILKSVLTLVVTGATMLAVNGLSSIGFPFLDQIPSAIWDMDQGTVTLVLAWFSAMGLHAGGKAIKKGATTTPAE